MKAVSGIGDIADAYDAFILDIWGVLHNGVEPFTGTIDCLKRLRDANKRVCLVSNSPSRADHIVAMLAAMDIPRDLYTGIMTSGESVWHGFEKYRGRSFWHFGSPFYDFDQDDLLRDFGVTMTPSLDGANFFVNDYFVEDTDDLSHAKNILTQTLKRGLPMVCTNPDMVVDVGDNTFICPGRAAKLYEDMGGHVDYHGKPHRPIYEAAQELLGGLASSRICAVGDSLHTDIQGAENFGMDSVLNLEGIHRRELDLDDGPVDINGFGIKTLVESQPHRPTYVMNGFRW